MYEAEFGMTDHGIPDALDVNMGKLGGKPVNTDTCNGALKQQRLMNGVVSQANEEGNGTIIQPCHQHLRNIWFGTAIKVLQNHLSIVASDSLEKIDSRLHATTSIDALLCAVDKCFSKTNNYHQGDGESSHHEMELQHPGSLLFAVEQVKGSRQDISVKGSCALYWSCPYYLKFLFD